MFRGTTNHTVELRGRSASLCRLGTRFVPAAKGCRPTICYVSVLISTVLRPTGRPYEDRDHKPEFSLAKRLYPGRHFFSCFSWTLCLPRDRILMGCAYVSLPHLCKKYLKIVGVYPSKGKGRGRPGKQLGYPVNPKIGNISKIQQ